MKAIGEIPDSTSANGQQSLPPYLGESSTIRPSERATQDGVGDPTHWTCGRKLLDVLHPDGYHPGRWAAFEELTDEQCLTVSGHYKRLVQAVPFALLLPDLPPERLIAKCPILLLSILLTASSFLVEVQKQADEVFRRVLADRVVVKGQSSLELCQGLLIYLTWYNHRFDPEIQQFYQLQQMATAMAAELGLSKKFADINDSLQLRSLDDINEARAFLLCYYLSCGTAVLGYDRPENMHCIRSLRNAARLLARSPSPPLDVESPAIIELMYIVAQHRNLVNCRENGETSAQMREEWSSETALSTWEDRFLHPASPCVVRSSYHFISTYRLLKRTDHTPPSPEDVAACLATCQAQLSNILHQDPAYLVIFGIVEWAPVLTYLFLLPRVEAAMAAAAAATTSTPISTADKTPCTTSIIGRFRRQVAELKAQAELDPTLTAHTFFGWLDKIFASAEKRAAALQKGAQAMPTSRTLVDGGASAYELVHPSTGDSHDDDLARRPREAALTMERLWADFMSDWLQW